MGRQIGISILGMRPRHAPPQTHARRHNGTRVALRKIQWQPPKTSGSSCPFQSSARAHAMGGAPSTAPPMAQRKVTAAASSTRLQRTSWQPRNSMNMLKLGARDPTRCRWQFQFRSVRAPLRATVQQKRLRAHRNPKGAHIILGPQMAISIPPRRERAHRQLRTPNRRTICVCKTKANPKYMKNL
jgi:hypothetical protein